MWRSHRLLRLKQPSISARLISRPLNPKARQAWKTISPILPGVYYSLALPVRRSIEESLLCMSCVQRPCCRLCKFQTPICGPPLRFRFCLRHAENQLRPAELFRCDHKPSNSFSLCKLKRHNGFKKTQGFKSFLQDQHANNLLFGKLPSGFRAGLWECTRRATCKPRISGLEALTTKGRVQARTHTPKS